MKKKLFGAAMSAALSATLLSDVYALSQFGFYVALIMNALAWILLLLGGASGSAAKELRRFPALTFPVAAFGIYALIAHGSPILAASSFMVQFFIYVTAFSQKEVAA